jgi:hypothetical protein
MPINNLNDINSVVHEVEAHIGIAQEQVLVHCCYEDIGEMPTIYHVMFENIDIQGCLSDEQIDELEVFADQVLKTLYEDEVNEAKISNWESDVLGKVY